MRAPGLRGRIALSLALTAAVALGVAAFALLKPLEQKLRAQELRDLVAAGVQSRPAFRELDPRGPDALRRLRHTVRHVATTTGARVALVDANRNVVVNTDRDARDTFPDVAAALRTDRPVRRIIPGRGTPEVRVAVRVHTERKLYVLALRKRLTEQRAAVLQVRRAFFTAALVALAVALVVAAVFAATVGRRVRALRSAVIDFHVGESPDALPHDRAGDEVGDLSRAFREMARRLQREEEVRRDFVATASHELRTPLMTLQGRLELLSEELGRPAPDLADGRRQLEHAREQADRLGRLASDLLDLSRLDAEVELRRDEIDLSEVVQAVCSEFTQRAAEERRELLLDAEPVRVVADPTACARVVGALLDNACRYSEPESPVELTVEPLDGEGWVRVRDHGPGIPAADRDRIFERFARGSTAGGAGGFGLGLAIADELSRRMGGSLELTSHGTSGTTFALRMPRAS